MRCRGFRIALLPAVLAAVLALASCREAPPVLRVGCQADTALGGALSLAKEGIERSGSPVRVELVFDEAPHWIPSEIIETTAAFCRDPEILAVIGFTNSDASLAAAHLLNRHHVVQVVPNATSPRLDGAGPWTFRLCPGDDEQAGVLAHTAYRTLGAARCAVLYQNNDYGRDLSGLFRSEFESLGGTIPFSAPLGSGFDDPTNLDLYVRRVIESGPDLLVLICQSYQAVVVREELVRQGSALPLLGSDSLVTQSSLDKRIKALEGMHVLLFYHHEFETPGNAEFVRRYRTLRGVPPSYEAALAHDALMLLHQAVLEGARTREEVRGWLAALSGERRPFPGLAGPILFDERQRVNRSMSLGLIHDGELQLVSHDEASAKN